MKKRKILVLILIASLLIIFPLTINAASGFQINPENYHSDRT